LERKRNYPSSENIVKKLEKKDKLKEYDKDLSKFEIKLRKRLNLLKRSKRRVTLRVLEIKILNIY